MWTTPTIEQLQEAVDEVMVARQPFPDINQRSQRQDSVADQLRDLQIVATRLGMYDAADWLGARRPRKYPS